MFHIKKTLTTYLLLLATQDKYQQAFSSVALNASECTLVRGKHVRLTDCYEYACEHKLLGC